MLLCLVADPTVLVDVDLIALNWTCDMKDIYLLCSDTEYGGINWFIPLYHV